MMKRTLQATLALVALSSVASALQAQKPTDFASPFVGTDGHGHTYPGATVPFGMVQLSPDTRTDTWDGCSGYHYSDKRILGFSHTHLSGTGVGCLGDIMVMPFVGSLSPGVNVTSAFSHNQESAKPGYYRVYLADPKVTAEMTATIHAGFHRYTFPQSGEAHLAIDLGHGIQNDVRKSTLRVEDKSTLSGYRTSSGWGGERTVYFVMRFSRPFDSVTVEADGKLTPKALVNITRTPGKIRAFANYGTKAGEAIQVRVGVSATSVEAARRNLDQEIPGWSFDKTRDAAVGDWNKALGTATIQTKDEAVKRTFYSNLYLSFQAPNRFNDADGSYWGMDHKVHSPSGFENYSTYSLWDTYRALNPLVALLQPKDVDGMVNSLLAGYDQSGQHNTGVWTLGGNETWCMIGNHSISMISEALLKGYKGFDAERAYQAMRDTAMQDRNDLDLYKKLGYVASSPGRTATSKTIEYAYNDFCLAKVAEKLWHREDAQMFYRRAANYRNLWDGTSRFFRGRKEMGAWRTPFDPLGQVGDEYTESDAWQYLFAVQHDVPGMIALQGGDEGFVKRLDEMFTMDSTIHTNIPDITGLIGQYAHGNEPCHHVAYLYNYAGAPWKTQQRVRQVMTTLYSDKPDGETGNVDCGQTSAWYVFSALGFYPVNPASGDYILGSPLVDKATLHLVGGKTFTVVAENNGPKNVYVQSATLNGKPFAQNWISHNQIEVGGTLKLGMGPRPNKSWGSAVASRPPTTMPRSAYSALPEPASTKRIILMLPIRITAGEDESVEGFVADPNMMEGSTNGGRMKIDVSAPKAGPEKLYMSERYGSDFTYRFSVPKDRAYTVRLHFAEVFDSGKGERVEDVFVNGERVLKDFDIFSEAGGTNKAVVREWTGVKPDAHGIIAIRVKATASSPDQNAKISGLEILP
ncbi:GH92 family glycosyl hydrolase [soil metagenome]